MPSAWLVLDLLLAPLLPPITTLLTAARDPQTRSAEPVTSLDDEWVHIPSTSHSADAVQELDLHSDVEVKKLLGKKMTVGFATVKSKIHAWRGPIFALVCAMLLTFVMGKLVMQEERFDPFEALGIERGAEPVEIRKAFRKMSLRYHPDFHQTAEDHDGFVRVAKAYEILTSDESRLKACREDPYQDKCWL